MEKTLKEIQTQLIEPKGRLLTVAHRGDWLDYPENSLLAFRSCIDMGIDIIEFDVHQTKDNELIVMHDLTVDRTTNGKGIISEMTLDEIKQLYLKEGAGGDDAKLTSEKVPTLLEAMNIVKGKIMVNLDKCWDNRGEVYNVLMVTDTIGQVIMKSQATNKEVECWLKSKSVKPYYCAVFTPKKMDQLENFINGAKPQIYEFIYDKGEDNILSNPIIKKIKDNARIWVNTMWGELCGGGKDNISTWTALINKGVNVIQTDNLKGIINYK